MNQRCFIWHGLVVPFSQDGVPGVTGQAIAENGGIAVYDYDILHPEHFLCIHILSGSINNVWGHFSSY